MHGPMHPIFLSRPIKLGNYYRSTAGKSHKKAHQQVDQRTGGSSYCCQRLLSHEPAHHHGVRRIVKLLKKCSQKDREKKQQKLSENTSLCDAIFPGL